MTKTNGKVAADVAAAAVKQAEWQPGTYRLSADELTPRDLKRARKILGGRSPFELLDDPDERFTLLIWCLKSRHIPGFTWEQAEDTTFSEFLPAEDRNPPQTPPLEQSGNDVTSPSVSGQPPTPPTPEPAPSSASSSA